MSTFANDPRQGDEIERTLIPSGHEKAMVNKIAARLNRQFKRVDDLYFSSILCPQQCSQN
jgi:hypothetical protein